MKHNLALTITSVLSLALFGLHWSDEISRGMEVGTMSAFGGIIILVGWLYGALAFRGRLAGYIVTLLGGILGLGVLVIHMQGAGIVSRRIADTPGIFFWVTTLVALGVISSISALLSVHGLWSLRRTQPR